MKQNPLLSLTSCVTTFGALAAQEACEACLKTRMVMPDCGAPAGLRTKPPIAHILLPAPMMPSAGSPEM